MSDSNRAIKPVSAHVVYHDMHDYISPHSVMRTTSLGLAYVNIGPSR